MNGNTALLWTTVDSLRKWEENPTITIGRALTVANGAVLLEIELKPSEKQSVKPESKNGQQWVQNKLPGID